jgi:hypothetical protein
MEDNTHLEQLKSIILTDKNSVEYRCQSEKIGYETMLKLNVELKKDLPQIGDVENNNLNPAWESQMTQNSAMVKIKLIKKLFCIPEEISLDDFDQDAVLIVDQLIDSIGFLVQILKMRTL